MPPFRESSYNRRRPGDRGAVCLPRRASSRSGSVHAGIQINCV